MPGSLNRELGVKNFARLAAIDLGSNSFHILVAEVVNGRMIPIRCWGEKVQLAAGLEESPTLTQAAKHRAYDCLQRFAVAINSVPAEQVLVAGTDALRRAEDRDEFVRQAERILGVPVTIISGEQEARLIYQGVIRSHKAKGEGAAQKTLVVDIGGGSTELILGNNEQVSYCKSLPLGCVSYSRRFFPQQSSQPENFYQAVDGVSRELAPYAEAFDARHWQQAIGSAGTALAIGSVLRAKGWTSGSITLAGLKGLAKLLCQGERVANMHLPGLNKERFDIVTAGVAIMLAVFQSFNIEKMQTSAESLREGLIYSMLPNLYEQAVS